MALTTYGQAQALAANLPGGTNRYVALFTTLPDTDGTGGVECTGSSYARVLHTAWTNAVADDITYRKNNGTIEFAALSDVLSGVVGWGIFDALTNGNLIAFGEVRDVSAVAVTKDFVAGDQPRFLDQELKVAVG